VPVHPVAPRDAAEPAAPWGDEIVTLAEAEARYLAWCAERVPNRAQLAAQLGIGERTLYRKLARLRSSEA